MGTISSKSIGAKLVSNWPLREWVRRSRVSDARAVASNEICDLATPASGWVSSTGDRRCF